MEAKAASIGVKVGSIVTTTLAEGYGTKTKIVTRRYRVSEIVYCGYRQHGLTLWGIAIKKNGDEGEKHEIWRDWEVERFANEAPRPPETEVKTLPANTENEP